MSGAALHSAVFAALMADGPLTGLVEDRIFDAPPRDADLPYVTIGEWTAADWSTATESGAEHRFTIHTWSRARGKAESWELIDRLREALHDKDLPLPGQALVNLRFDRAAVSLDPDRRTWHGIARFRAVTEPATG